MRLILDMGSGNTCQNDKGIVRKMLDRLFWVDGKRCDIVVKWQLFQKPINNNIPLKHDVFDYAYGYAEQLGYQTTASVFDKDSLRFLLGHDIPFVKFSCNTKLVDFKGLLSDSLRVYKSINDGNCCIDDNIVFFSCVPKYPASAGDYFDLIGPPMDGCFYFISDHTSGWDVFDRYKPLIYECHYKLESSTGLDSGVFARTPDMLRRIIG